jgi:hypothetical protein
MFSLRYEFLILIDSFGDPVFADVSDINYVIYANAPWEGMSWIIG